MPILAVPIPLTTPIARPRNKQLYPDERQKDPNEGLLSEPWVNYLGHQSETIETAVRRLFAESLTEQGASISPTDISGGGVTGGLYSFRYYARITREGTISSSLTVTLDWRDGGVTVDIAGAAITGNTTDSFQDATHLIHVDGAAPIRYATTYASAGATSMQYSLYVVLERVNG